MKKVPHLVIFRFSSLGDVAITVPVLRTLFATYPQLKVTFVSKPFCAPLFKEFKSLRFYPLDLNGRHKGMAGMYRLYKELLRLDVNAIADLHQVLRTEVLRRLFYASGYFNVATIQKGRKEKKALTRAKNKKLLPLTPTVYRYADVFRRLGYPVDLSQHEFPALASLPPAIQQDFAQNQMQWIGVAPFATHPGKVYPLDFMQKVIGFLEKEYQIFLFGAGVEETRQLDIWEHAFKNVYNTAGKLALDEQLDVMGHLDIMLAMDSANGHMAANANVPVVTLWGMTHPFAGFAPFGQQAKQQIMVDRTHYPKIPSSIYGNKVPPGYEKAFRSIAPEHVIDTVIRQLNSRLRQSLP